MQTTILYITRQIDTTVESDKVIYMNQGRVKEIGTPIELLHNPKSRFSSMVQKTNPELHQRLKTQMKKVKNNRIKLRASKNQ
jgi:ABC-type sugar transport system ATPase subunit